MHAYLSLDFYCVMYVRQNPSSVRYYQYEYLISTLKIHVKLLYARYYFTSLVYLILKWVFMNQSLFTLIDINESVDTNGHLYTDYSIVVFPLIFHYYSAQNFLSLEIAAIYYVSIFFSIVLTIYIQCYLCQCTFTIWMWR